MRLLAAKRIEQPHKRHRTSSRHASNNHHLRATLCALPHLPPSAPTRYEASLPVSKCEQCQRHGSQTPPQRQHDLVFSDEKVWHKWDESSEEVTACDCQGAGGSSRSRWFWLRVLEVHEELYEIRRLG